MSTTTAVPDPNQRNYVIMTQVVPSAGAGPGLQTVGVPMVTSLPNMNPVTSAPGALQKFLKVQPKALGTVQITVGVMMFVVGVVLTVFYSPFSVYTGIHYWGSVIYIITGSLTVAAENNLHSCLVKGSLGMNVVSAVIAGTGIILLSLDFVVDVFGYGPCYGYPYDPQACRIYLEYVNLNRGISGVLLVFNVLQFFISICISAFGCRATCCTQPVVSVVAVPHNHPACCSMVSPFHTHSGQQDVFYITNPNANMPHPPTESPPAYNTTTPKPEN